jgi:hypothetical protein
MSRVGFWSLAGWVLKECCVIGMYLQVLEAEGESPDGANLNRAEKVGMLSVTFTLFYWRTAADVKLCWLLMRQARVRLVCAGGVLKLMRNRHVQHRLMTTDR